MKLIKQKSTYFYFLLFLVIIIFTFRSLVLNLTTNLPDWMDYAAVNWMIYQNIDKITSLQFSNYFDTNAFYPHRYSLLFADSFLPQALMEIPFYLLTNNLILSFNIIFIFTFILNYLSSYLFWKELFKNNFLAFLGGLFVVFSPFFHLEKSHFQMMAFWPFFLSLYYLFKKDEINTRNALLVGIFLAIQFLASVYISIYLSFTILLFFFIKLVRSDYKLKLIQALLIIFVTFIALDSIFIKGYLDMKDYYQMKKNPGEIIMYSAHITDYLFTNNINSTLNHLPIIVKWNSFNKNFIGGQASFPGFLLFFLSLFGLFKLVKNKQFFSINISLKKESIFFLIMLLAGFIFSLGPRINFNGAYAHIPAPYSLISKLLPVTDFARAPCRWSFIFYIAIIYFALFLIKKLQSKQHFKFMAAGIVLLFLFEYVPINIQTHKEDYIDNHYQLLRNICANQKKTVLEIPVTHMNVYPNIGLGVNYISKVEFSSTYHKCNLANGYSSYDMPSILTMSYNLNQSMVSYNWKKFISELKKNQVDIIKINIEFLHPDLRESATYLLKNGSKLNLRQLDNQMLLIN